MGRRPQGHTPHGHTPHGHRAGCADGSSSHQLTDPASERDQDFELDHRIWSNSIWSISVWSRHGNSSCSAKPRSRRCFDGGNRGGQRFAPTELYPCSKVGAVQLRAVIEQRFLEREPALSLCRLQHGLQLGTEVEHALQGIAIFWRALQACRDVRQLAQQGAPPRLAAPPRLPCRSLPPGAHRPFSKQQHQLRGHSRKRWLRL